MLRHIRTYESHTGRREEIYNEQGERLFSVDFYYVPVWQMGGSKRQEYVGRVVAHCDVKGESPEIAYLRVLKEEKNKEKMRLATKQAMNKRLLREADAVWNERVQAARILSRNNLKSVARFLIQDYLNTHSV